MTTTRTVLNPHIPPHFPHATNFPSATGSYPNIDASPTRSTTLMKFASLCPPDTHDFIQPQPSMATDGVQFNTNIFSPPLPHPNARGSGDDLLSRVIAAQETGSLKSVDYLHKYARATGKYPKLGMFCTPGGCDVDPLDAHRRVPVHPITVEVSPVDQLSISSNLPFHDDDVLVETRAAGSDEPKEEAKHADPAVQKKKLLFTELDDFATSNPRKRRSLVDYFEPDSEEQEDEPSTPDGSEYRDSSPEFVPSITFKLPNLQQPRAPSSPNKKRKLASAFTTDLKPSHPSANVQPQASSSSATAAYKEAELQATDTGDQPYDETRDKHGKIIYQCRECPGFRTRALGDMGRHLESKAHKPPSHCCHLCPSVFTRKDALVRHEKRKHRLGGW